LFGQLFSGFLKSLLGISILKSFDYIGHREFNSIYRELTLVLAFKFDHIIMYYRNYDAGIQYARPSFI
jgi:hypothetical protein